MKAQKAALPPDKYYTQNFRSLPGLLLLFALLLCVGSKGLVSGTPQAKRDFPIQRVQLYSNQAQVFRIAKRNFHAGKNEIVVKGLPSGLRADTIRLNFSNPAGLRIREIRVETQYHDTFPSEKAEQVERLLHSAEGRLRRLTARYKLLEEEDRYLRSLRFASPPKNKEPEKTRLDIRQWKRSLDFRALALEKTHQKKMALQEKIDAAREELLVAMALAERYKSKRRQATKSIRVFLDSERTQSSQVELSYRLKGAAWYPVYAVRVLTEGKDASSRARVHLLSYALVKNQTGEDWKNVRLRFSAADPGSSMGVLSLKSWKIRPVERELLPANSMQEDSVQAEKRAPNPSLASRSHKKSGRRQKRRPLPEQAQRARPMSERIQKAQSYYQKNQSELSAKRSRKRSQKSERILKKYKMNQMAQGRALRRGDYRASLKYSEAILDNLRHLPPKYQAWFKEEQLQAKRARAMSLRMLENQKLIRRLIRPHIGRRGFDYRYQAPLREDIHSDGSFHKIFLGEHKLRASLHYETAPLRSLHAFLVGKVAYKEKAPLLAGPVSVFHNSDYLGEAKLQSISAGRPFEVHLGSDENIEVSRRTHSYRTTGGIIGKTFRYEKEIRIRIRNLKRQPIPIHVFERLPYSSDERIHIRALSIRPKPSKADAKRGFYRFSLKIPPGKVGQVSLRYSIEHPVDVQPVFRERTGRW